jgi:hypothetical protein
MAMTIDEKYTMKAKCTVDHVETICVVLNGVFKDDGTREESKKRKEIKKPRAPVNVQILMILRL